MTCFGLCTGPSSGHKLYNWGDYTEWIIDKIVWVIKIEYIYIPINKIQRDLVVVQFPNGIH